ncbi:MAG: hypothetical protein QXR97_07000 [Thermoproteota archaeon]
MHFQKERIVSVYAAADKEYMNHYDDWWNPWDQDEWKIIIILAVELGDDAFEREFKGRIFPVEKVAMILMITLLFFFYSLILS